MQSSDLGNTEPRSAGAREQRRYLAVAQQLLSEVQRGEFGEQGRLPADRDLAMRFAVSRTTLREAIFALELVGVLNVRHGDGTFVTRFRLNSPGHRAHELAEQPRQVIDARLTLEPPLSALIAQQPDRLRIDALLADLDRVEAMIGDATHLPTFVNLAMRFHADLVSACPNAILARFTSELVEVDQQPLWILLNQVCLQDRPAQETLLREHRGVLDAIRAGSPEAAQLHMHEHLLANKRLLFSEPAERGAAHEEPPEQTTTSTSGASNPRRNAA